MRRRATTLTAMAPFPRRSTILVDDQLLRVRKTAGTGPYTLKVRPIARLDRFASSVRYYLTAPKRWLRRRQEARWDRLDAKEAADV